MPTSWVDKTCPDRAAVRIKSDNNYFFNFIIKFNYLYKCITIRGMSVHIGCLLIYRNFDFKVFNQ